MKGMNALIVTMTRLLTLGPYLSAKHPSEARAEQERLQNSGR